MSMSRKELTSILNKNGENNFLRPKKRKEFRDIQVHTQLFLLPITSSEDTHKSLWRKIPLCTPLLKEYKYHTSTTLPQPMTPLMRSKSTQFVKYLSCVKNITKEISWPNLNSTSFFRNSNVYTLSKSSSKAKAAMKEKRRKCILQISIFFSRNYRKA